MLKRKRGNVGRPSKRPRIDLESQCTICCELERNKDTLHIAENTVLIKHLDVRLLNRTIGQKKFQEDEKQQRSKFVQDLEKLISALRNEEGGAILIHIDGFASDDTYLDSFNELVDDKINDMIDDGSLFVDIFKKAVGPITGYPSVLVLTVQPTLLISTSNFSTKVPLDNLIKDPPSNTVFNFLKNQTTFSQTTATLRGLQNIHENRCVQVKQWFTDKDNYVDTYTPTEFSERIWSNLRLGWYISAFSKIDGGGSFYVGVSEVPKKYHEHDYETKEYKTEGFALKWKDDTTQKQLSNDQLAFDTVKKHLQNKVTSSTLILRFNGQCEPPTEDVIDVAFHPVTGRSTFVLEVAVAAVNGLFFYDKNGPESYKLNGTTPIRLTPEEWYERLRGTF